MSKVMAPASTPPAVPSESVGFDYALLALLHLALAGFLNAHADWPDGQRRLVSRTLMGGSILLPAGFFLGGLFVYDGDPGLGIYLVPIGALLLIVAVFLAARASSRMTTIHNRGIR